MKLTYIGSDERVFPSLGVTVNPGDEVDAPEGYLALKDFSMFGGFSGGKGVAGVARGEKGAEVILDKFEDGEIGYFPLTSCYGVLPSVDLYKFKGTKLR